MKDVLLLCLLLTLVTGCLHIAPEDRVAYNFAVGKAGCLTNLYVDIYDEILSEYTIRKIPFFMGYIFAFYHKSCSDKYLDQELVFEYKELEHTKLYPEFFFLYIDKLTLEIQYISDRKDLFVSHENEIIK